IAARNEVNNLKNLIPSLLNQNYNEFEIIIANDRSKDDSSEYLEKIALENKKLKHIKIKEETGIIHGKKHALSQAIKAAKHEILLFTDADCIPSSQNWIKAMTSALKADKEIVLGYGAFFLEKTWINSLIRYDASIIAMQYLGMAKAGLPYMGVGRNIMYKKSLWEKHNGFDSHKHIASGDDDLFIMQASTATNTATVLNLDAICYSKAKANFKDWQMQKIRHLSTAKKYKASTILLLITEPLSRILLIFSLFYSFFAFSYFISSIFISLILFRSLILCKINNKFFKITEEKNIGIKLVLFDLLLPFIYLYLNIIKTLKKREQNWK
ncbi:MAG: glycosyltransferase, partial [Bacteroidales bacterium]|nr:glycosyltransferase [Bacteroidales bacterium]